MTGYWKADLYGYFDTSIFTRTCVPDSSGFAGSSKVHMAAGLCKDQEKALRDGTLSVREHFCACVPCRELKLSDCLMDDCFGDCMRLVDCPKLRGGVALSQSATLAEWAGTLCAKQLVAFRVADDEQGAWGEGGRVVCCPERCC